MKTVKDLKEWLNVFPEDTEVQFAVQHPGGNYESYGALEFEEPDLSNNEYGKGWEFYDFRNNQFVKEDDPRFGKCYLELGERG
jgi:hypothetical protein